MKKISLFAAVLALCLALLPGTAGAAGETEVSFANEGNIVTLTDGKFYVAAAENKGITQQDDEPASGAYLSYNSGTLTVHGAFETTATITVNSNLTITGGANSSLNVTAAHGITVYMGNGSTLTLDGGVDFIADNGRNGGPVIQYAQQASTGSFAASSSYSGDIVINSTGSAPAVSSVPLDVKNSGSITITGRLSDMDSAVLQSAGDVSITTSSGPIEPEELTIKAANVKLINNNNTAPPVFTGPSLNIEATGNVLITNKTGTNGSPALMGTAEISAGGDVTISSDCPPIAQSSSTAVSLTVKNAQNVSISGKSSASNAFFLVPVTFENCGNVAATDSGTGDLMKAGVTVTSDKPWTAKTGEKTITLPSGSLTYAGAAPSDLLLSTITTPTYWKAGVGRIYYEPAGADTPAKLTLDDATYAGMINLFAANALTVEVKGRNKTSAISADGSVTLTGDGSLTANQVVTQQGNNITNNIADLNTVLVQFGGDKNTYEVYGEAELPRNSLPLTESDTGSYVNAVLTIQPGAKLTIPSGKTLQIRKLDCLTNNGTIVNNGTVILAGGAATGADAETVKGLGLSGSGIVQVMTNPGGGEVVETTYTNSGEKRLTPVGNLDLSAATTEQTSAWDSKGYKWTGVEKDDSNNITKGTLTLKKGFSATEVTLPGNGAEVTVKTEGDSSIGTLAYAGTTGSTAIHLTFEGGKLAVAKPINFSGDVGTSVTIANGAVVEANKGITVSAAAGVDGTITVNGTLTARGGAGNAVMTGKISVGPSGKLEVYGDTGVFLGGKSTDNVDKTDFTDAFLLSPGGRFTGSCATDIIAAQRNNGWELDEGLKAEDAIVIPDGYLPQGLERVFNGNRTKLSIPGGGAFNISADNVPQIPSGPSGSGHADCPSRAFSDLDTDKWYHEAVDYVLQNQLMGGYGNGRFGPDDPLSRAQFAQILYNREGQPPVQDLTRFADVAPQQWYARAVCWAASRGLVAGYGDGRFGPEDRITREQLALMLWRYAGSPGADEKDLAFTDAGKASGYAREALRWAVETGIVTGKDGGLLDPQGQATRAEAAAMLMRFFSLLK